MAISVGLVVTLVIPTAHAAKTTLTLGFQAPLSGTDAAVGAGLLSAAQFTVSEFNSRHANVQVNLLPIDDQGDGAIAGPLSASVAANSSVIGIVGPAYSGAAIGSFAAYRAAGIPLISPSATRDTLTIPSSNQNGIPVFHRVVPSSLDEGASIAETAIQATPGAQSSTRISLIGDSTYYSNSVYVGAASEFASAGVPFVYKNFPHLTLDYSAIVTSTLADSPQTVICAGYYFECGQFLKALRIANFAGKFITGVGVFDSTNKGFINSAGASVASGTLINASGIPLEVASPSMARRYTASTGLQPGVYATETMDAVNVFLMGIDRGANTRILLTKFISSYSGLSLSGVPISFNSNGDLDLPLLSNLLVNSTGFTYVGPALPTISNLSTLVSQSNLLIDSSDALSYQASSLLAAANNLLVAPNKTAIDANIWLVQAAKDSLASLTARSRNLQVVLSFVNKLKLTPVMVDNVTASRLALGVAASNLSSSSSSLDGATSALNKAVVKLRR